ncbi:hypothetical protein AOLI_G00031400 [Acnodon oligacanthus]
MFSVQARPLLIARLYEGLNVGPTQVLPRGFTHGMSPCSSAGSTNTTSLTPPPQTPFTPPPKSSPQASIPPFHQCLLLSLIFFRLHQHLLPSISLLRLHQYLLPSLHPYHLFRLVLSLQGLIQCLRLSQTQLQPATVLLSDYQCCSYISEASRSILGELAHLNARVQTLFQQAYDQLLAFTQNLSLHGVISAELVQFGVNSHLSHNSLATLLPQ